MRDAALDPQLRLVDAVLRDLAVRTGRFVARRAQDGDQETFVIQTGEEGRLRLDLPNLRSDGSIEAIVSQAQVHLTRELGVPVPLCPMHRHALVGFATDGRLRWRCPDGQWECALGEYEERTWPQLEVHSLAAILSRRLRRRGSFPEVRTIGVTRSGDQLVANFGIVEVNDELLGVLADVAAPLPVTTHESSNVAIRVGLPRDAAT